MNTAMKQRLVGTVVVGCLAIIFIPILLDGEGVSPPEMTTSIPEAPPLPVVPDTQPVRPQITADTLDSGQDPDTPPAVDEADESGAQTPASAARPQLDSAGIPATWTVRLGSFGELANAEALVARLRDGGYKAFSRPLDTSRGRLTGVYVGPVLTEAEAAGLQRELAQAYELEGVVVRFSIDALEQ